MENSFPTISGLDIEYTLKQYQNNTSCPLDHIAYSTLTSNARVYKLVLPH